MICGIYMIQCKVNKKIRIGSSENINKRLENHYSSLINNKHSVKSLQEDWNKYGKENFEFKVIEECNEDILIEKEQYYMDSYKSLNSELGYNKRMAGNNGKHSEESKLKMSIIKKGKKISEETKQKISIYNKGKIISKEQKESIINSNKNRIITEKTKQKISNSLKIVFKDKHNNSKITIEQSKEIKEKLNKGIKVKDLMLEYNCSSYPIVEIKHNRHWTCNNWD